jgi:hypothetical protein
MPVRIGCVVEGHGEVESVPVLIRKIAHEFDPGLQVVIPHPVRVTKSTLLKAGELERAAELAALNAGVGGGVLVLLDSDEDCPAQLGPKLLERVRLARADMPSAVVLARREFESWFLASAESLRGCRGLPGDLESPDQPEEIAGAKEAQSRSTSVIAKLHLCWKRCACGVSSHETLDIGTFIRPHTCEAAACCSVVGSME